MFTLEILDAAGRVIDVANYGQRTYAVRTARRLIQHGGRARVVDSYGSVVPLNGEARS